MTQQIFQTYGIPLQEIIIKMQTQGRKMPTVTNQDEIGSYIELQRGHSAYVHYLKEKLRL